MKPQINWTEEEEKIITTAIQEYGTDNKVEWRRAFNDHPDWEKQLLQRHTKGAIYAKGTDTRLKDTHGGKRPRTNGSQKTRVQSSVKVDGEVTAVSRERKVKQVHTNHEVNVCPSCAFPLRQMNDALVKANIQLPPYCPNCQFPVGIVRTAIRVSNRHNNA